MTTLVERLNELREKATQGPWSRSGYGYQILTGDSWNTICTFHGDGKDYRLAAWQDGRGAADETANSELICELVNNLDTIISALVSSEEGMVMVPREPTEAAIVAGEEAFLAQYENQDWEEAKDAAENIDVVSIYLAMIAAAPTSIKEV